jgi:hypothetical protein
MAETAGRSGGQRHDTAAAAVAGQATAGWKERVALTRIGPSGQ